MNPFNSLITRWRNRRRDRTEGEASRRQVIQSLRTPRENRIEDLKRIEAQQKDKELREKIETLANSLWEADGKPAGKEDYYKELAKLKIEAENISNPYKIYYSLEKNTLEPIESWLEKQAFFSILGRVGNLAIALISFIANEDTRHNNQVFTAWQTITSANGQTGSGGRIQAIEFLNSRPLKFPWIGWTTDIFWDESERICKEKTIWGLRRKREILNGISAANAYLSKIKLCRATLSAANIEEANLTRANLQKANLWGANVEEAILVKANLQKAILIHANLQKASLWGANVEEASLGIANLQEAILVKANLQKAILIHANLQEASLIQANLQEANLEGANLQQADLRGVNLQEANLEGVRNLTYQQIKSSCNWQQAIFKGEWNEEKEKYIPKEPDNNNFIKRIEAGRASDLETPPNCDRWNNQAK